MKRRSAAGFTLIEMMITIAIIGILGAIAIPTYQSYIARGEVGSGLASAAGFKINVDHAFAQGTAAATITPNSLGGTPDADFLGLVAANFQDDGTGELTFTFGPAASSKTRGGSIVLSRDVDGRWSCVTTGGAANYKPVGCT